MTLQECYEKMGGDYADVLKRLTRVERIEKFLMRFLEDTTFEALCEAIAAEDDFEVFRMIHNLKGVSQNLGFTKLYLASNAMTEAVRGGKRLEDESLFQEVKKAYKETLDVIKEYQKELTEY